jgi:anti-sigma factor RsiW
MDASETQALIQPYLDRQLEPALAEALTARLAADVALARLLEAERRFHEFLRRILADVPTPAGLQERIRGKIRGQTRRPGCAAGTRASPRVSCWA